MKSLKVKWEQLSYRVSNALRGGYYGIIRRDLASILADFRPHTELEDRIARIEELLGWIRTPVDPTKEISKDRHIQSVRVRFLLQLLERNPAYKSAVSEVFASVLLETDPLNLFCLTGLSRQSGVFTEAVDRLLRQVLPSPRNEQDLSELFIRIFSDEQDALWLESLDSATLEQLFSIIAPNDHHRLDLFNHYERALRDALTLLSSQIEALGFTPEIRLRTHVRSVRDSAFWQMRIVVAKIQMDAEQGRLEGLRASQYAHELLEQIQLSRTEISAALSHLEGHGVSVAIVYRLEQLERLLQRAETISKLRFATRDGHSTQIWVSLITTLIRDALAQTKIRNLFTDNMHLLARKIVERTGDSGEHYITQSRSEYVKMLISAAGGGALTSITTILKFWITALKPAPFVEGVLSTFNYAGSFLTMQALHMTLATKQPSMTAPALAAKLRNLKSEDQIESFVDEVAKITRSQFAAAIGNIGAVIPVAFLIDLIFWYSLDRHLISAEYAVKVVGSLNPLTSLTVPYAALTGVLLWMSSIAAGWVDNWFTYRRIPEAIAESSVLRAALGRSRTRSLSGWLQSRIAGVSGNVSLGFLLAFVPVFGRFFGAPLDVRHVTLSTGSFVFAVAAATPGALSPFDIAMAVVGIVLIGLLNFGVSFALALSLAINARNVEKESLRRLGSGVWLRMRHRFSEFLLP